MELFNKNKENPQLSDAEKKYTEKIKGILEAPQNEKIVKYIKYLYLNDTQEFINQTYPIKLLSILMIGVGIVVAIMSALLIPITIIAGIFLIAVGLFLYIYPFKALSFLLKGQMKSEQKKIYLERYDILRQMYYNEKMFGDAFHLPSARAKNGEVIENFIDENGNVLMSPSEVKKPTTIFRFLVALRSDEKPAFYEKLLDITNLFDDYELINFFKNVSENISGSNFEEYFELQQTENSANYTNVVKEKATIKQSTNVMILLGFAMIGLFVGIGAILQKLLTEIFTHVLSGLSGGAEATSSISSILSIFQIVTTAPPLALGFILLPIILFVLLFKLRKDIEEMFS